MRTAARNGDWLRAAFCQKSRGNATSRCLSPFLADHQRLARRENGTGTKAANKMFSSGKLVALLWSQSHFHDSLFTLSKQTHGFHPRLPRKCDFHPPLPAFPATAWEMFKYVDPANSLTSDRMYNVIRYMLLSHPTFLFFSRSK